MNLLHPGLLWLLPLAAIPIVLHLLVWPRLRVVELPTFRFLMDSYVYQRRRVRFLEAILAALRALFLAALVLSFCRPLVQPFDGLFSPGGASRDVVALLDASASMNASAGGATSLQRAKNHLKALVDRLGPDDRIALIRCDAVAQEVFSRYNSDPAAIKALIDEQECSPARSNLRSGWESAFGSSTAIRQGAEVHLLTDLQQNGWREIAEQNGLGRLPSGVRLHVVDVGSGRNDDGNRAAIGSAPERNQAIVGLPVELTARIRNDSATASDGLTLHVFINDKETARYPIALAPNATVTKRIVWVPTEAGIAWGRFELSGQAPDRFPDDDRFQFAIQAATKLKVLLINGKPNPRDPFQDEALYLRAALAAPSRDERERLEREKLKQPSLAADAGAAAPLEESELAQALDVREINEHEIRRREDLDDVSVVILANCRGLDDNRCEWLRDFVRNGGGLIFFPGDQTNISLFNDRFWTVPNDTRERFLDVDFGPPQGEVDKVETMERLAGLDESHPALAAFAGGGREAGYFRSVTVFRRCPLVPKSDGGRLWTFARLTSGEPALVEQKCGEGTVIVSSIPVSPLWTNLPLKSEFVPLVLRLIGHVRRAPKLSVSANVAPGAIAEIRAAPEWASASVQATDPRGRVRPLELQRDGPKAVAAYDATRIPGFYKIEARGPSAGSDQTETTSFAVNLDPEESEFKTVTEEQVRAWAPGVDVLWIDSTAERLKQDGGDRANQPSEVWRWLIYGLFLIIGLEFLLATLAGSDPSRAVH